MHLSTEGMVRTVLLVVTDPNYVQETPEYMHNSSVIHAGQEVSRYNPTESATS